MARFLLILVVLALAVVGVLFYAGIITVNDNGDKTNITIDRKGAVEKAKEKGGEMLGKGSDALKQAEEKLREKPADAPAASPAPPKK